MWIPLLRNIQRKNFDHTIKNRCLGLKVKVSGACLLFLSDSLLKTLFPLID